MRPSLSHFFVILMLMKRVPGLVLTHFNSYLKLMLTQALLCSNETMQDCFLQTKAEPIGIACIIV